MFSLLAWTHSNLEKCLSKRTVRRQPSRAGLKRVAVDDLGIVLISSRSDMIHEDAAGVISVGEQDGTAIDAGLCHNPDLPIKLGIGQASKVHHSTKTNGANLW